MVASLDLQPLTEETIAQMGYEQHDLWLVKIGTIVFGPFETESLKHYVGENEHLFDNALAHRMDTEKYKAFWEHPTFQRRKLQSVRGESPNDGPFWLLHNGLKVGPFSFNEIDKKIEVGVLGMTDHISTNDGHSWPKIYEIHQFDRRSLGPDELPVAPRFSKLEIVEPITPKNSVTNGLAGMAHVVQSEANVIPFKIDELTLDRPKEDTEVSSKLKWMIPMAVAGLFAIGVVGKFIISNTSTPLISEDETQDQPFYKLPAARNPSHDTGANVHRRPASITYTKRYHEPSNQESSAYPTHIETHEPSYDDMVATEPVDPGQVEIQPTEEHSLVGNENSENQSLDAAMNGVEQPVVEEVSDF